MKKSYFKLIATCLLLLIIFFLNSIYKILSIYPVIVFLLITFVILVLVFVYEKDRIRYKNDLIILIILYSGTYLIITYLLGLFVGFNYNGYSLKFINIIKNITPILMLIIISELNRYILIRKGSTYKLILILTAITFIFLDITLKIRGYNLKINEELLKFIVVVVLPSIAKNIFLTYLVGKGGFRPAIVYRFIFELPMYLLPIFPAFGIYIDSVLNILFPSFLMYMIYRNFIKIEQKLIVERINHKLRFIGPTVTTVFLLIIVALVSNLFKYFVLTIGSGSMSPNINKGDIIFVTKVKKNEMNKLSEGDILVFKKDSTTIVHRIIKTEFEKGSYTFYTKGDNNESPDGYPISEKDVIGITGVRIPYLGWPTVIISELIS